MARGRTIPEIVFTVARVLLERLREEIVAEAKDRLSRLAGTLLDSRWSMVLGTPLYWAFAGVL